MWWEREEKERGEIRTSSPHACVRARVPPSDVGLFAVTSVTRGRTMVYEFCKMQRLEMCSFGGCDSKKRVVKAMKG